MHPMRDQHHWFPPAAPLGREKMVISALALLILTSMSSWEENGRTIQVHMKMIAWHRGTQWFYWCFWGLFAFSDSRAKRVSYKLHAKMNWFSWLKLQKEFWISEIPQVGEKFLKLNVARSRILFWGMAPHFVKNWVFWNAEDFTGFRST